MAEFSLAQLLWSNPMSHPEQTRRAYLQAMGIDVWLTRDAADNDPRNELADSGASATETATSHLPENCTWDDLRERVASCSRCILAQSRTQAVFGVGKRDADWMIVGEAPGAEEDRHGEPFVGRAGNILDEMLRAIGESRDSVFITNIMKCRPPNNRDPEASEAAACRDYLQRQIELVQPKILLAVGKTAAQNLLGSSDAVSRMRGKEHQFNGIPLVVTYHPAYLLRSPAHKRKSWFDLCLAMQLATKGGA